MTEKTGQIFGLDLMIAMIIFLIGIMAFFLYSINSPSETKESLSSLFYDGDLITDSLLSEGYPQDWNSDDVIKIGISDNKEINQTKLERFYDLAQTNYAKTKSLFNTKYNYYFFLSQTMTINSEQVEGIGKPGVNKENIQASNLIKVTRVTSYNKKPVSAYLYIWEE